LLAIFFKLSFKTFPSWFGTPYSIPFFIIGSVSAIIAGVYSPDEYDFWKCLCKLR
jgi:hypothetical protein